MALQAEVQLLLSSPPGDQEATCLQMSVPALSGVREQVFPYILGVGLFPVLAPTLSPLYQEFRDELTTNVDGCNGSHLCTEASAEPQEVGLRVLPGC